MPPTEWGPVLVMVVAASVTDLLSHRIPNAITIPFLGLGLLAGAWTGGWQGLGRSAGGIGVAVLLVSAFCLLGGMGWGDLKLCAAVGAWLGPNRMMYALIVTAVAGGVAALVVLLWRGAGYKLPARLSIHDPGALKIPYAPAIAIGTLFALLIK